MEELRGYSYYGSLLFACGGRNGSIYLNEVVYLKNILLRVRKYIIGGYEVVKKLRAPPAPRISITLAMRPRSMIRISLDDAA